MGRYTIEVEKQIEAAHLLEDSEWLVTKACARPHGHSYRIEAIAEFDRLLPNGMACDFRVIKDAINAYDHQDLNAIFSPTTAEAFADRLVEDIDRALAKYGAPADALTVSISETGSSWVTVTRD